MRAENPSLFWRSRHHNVINPFYYAESDGCFKQPRWKAYWYGLGDFATIERCVEHCRTRVATLEDPIAA
jgi:acetylglutamate kinase